MSCIHGVRLSEPCRECQAENAAREQRMKAAALFTFAITGGDYVGGEKP